MTISEFSLIDQYFKSRTVSRDDVIVGIGDDAAITSVPDGMQLVTAVDTLVNGIHFAENVSPFSIGYKSLAVNLSDLAAMGAQPAWATLALTMPEADETWVKDFADGFFQLAEKFNIQLIGGDTTQGPLTVSVQVAGLLPKGSALTRGGANVGDLIYVSGTVGDAAAGLHIREKNSMESSVDHRYLIQRLDQPVPRIELGIALRGIASAVIDISDGLVADLGHILNASGAGATLRREQLPLSNHLTALNNELGEEQIIEWALQGGDDYELCFCASESFRIEIDDASKRLNLAVSEIGIVESPKKIRLLNKNVCTEIDQSGYQHFSKS